MSKNIFAVSASSRKGGNSDILIDEFLKGAKAAGHETEKVYIIDKKIHYCLGCGVCRKDKGVCVHKDDMTAILDKMKTADVLLFATPIYFYSMNGPLKIFIDRCYARFIELKNKEVYIIVTGAADAEHYFHTAVEGLRGFIACLPEAKEKGIVYGFNAGDAGSIRNTAAPQKTYEMGKLV